MREKILQVKTFGSFSMIYDGKSLFGRKVGETQFASMMQMLIHERKKGVSRDRLEQELFGEREVENVHHALQSVIYNAKKRLEKAGLYREKQNYTQLEHLGVYASNIEPFSDWEVLTMEAMVALGRYEEATDLYADTAERYFEERGLKPSKRLLDSMNQLGNQVMHSYDVLDNIQHNLEEKGIPKGAYLCSYPTFRGIYHHLVRMLERSGQSIYLMLCTIVDSKGRPMKEGAMLEGLAKRLEESICTSIRNSDVVNHYSKGQYLVLLINTTREDCAVIQKRINYKFLTDRQRTGVRYYVNSVVYEKDL